MQNKNALNENNNAGAPNHPQPSTVTLAGAASRGKRAAVIAAIKLKNRPIYVPCLFLQQDSPVINDVRQYAAVGFRMRESNLQ